MPNTQSAAGGYVIAFTFSYEPKYRTKWKYLITVQRWKDAGSPQFLQSILDGWMSGRKFHGNLFSRWHFVRKHKCQTHSGTGGKVRGLILSWPGMSVQMSVAIHSADVHLHRLNVSTKYHGNVSNRLTNCHCHTRRHVARKASSKKMNATINGNRRKVLDKWLIHQ